MAYASITYTSASGTTFALTNSNGDAIEYLRQSDIAVTVNGVLQTVTTDYTYNAAGTAIVLNSSVSNATVVIARTTDIADATVSFTAGSTLTAQDLNNSDKQNRFALQEFSDTYGGLTTGTGDLSALAGFIGGSETWVSDDAHAATTAGIDARIDEKTADTLTDDVIAGNAITISDDTPSTGQITIAVTNGAIDTAELADDAVTTAKITDSNVTTAKINNDAVTTAKILDGNVTTAKLANDAVTSAKIADGTIVAGDLANNAVTTAKILDANVTTAKILDGNVTTAKINDGAVTEGKIASGAVTATKIGSGAVDSTKLSSATIVTAAEQSGHTTADTDFFTTAATDARYFRQDSSETISSGDTWSGSDSYIATTAAIDARIVDLVDDVGGFVPIANETSFPTYNPDINVPPDAGTIISVKEIVTTRTPAAGVVTITNGAGSNTVTINGCGSTVLASGFGVLVETTSTLHTYTFHRLVPKATEVTTVAGISSDITTVATNVSDVQTVATNIADVNTVATNIADVNTVSTDIADVSTVATNITDVNTFANVYRISASDPTTSLDVGDLVFNTTNNKIRIYNGSSWQDGVTATGDIVSKTGDTMTGAFGIISGTAAAPGLFVSGDLNTGIYSPGADQIAVSTGGSQRLLIDSSGNINIDSNTLYVDAANNRVGLGINNPATTLDINGDVTITDKIIHSGDTDTTIRFSGADTVAIETAGTERVEFGTGEVVFNDGGENYDFRIEGDTNANLFFVDASTDRVGLGTSTPVGRLSVVGSAGSGEDGIQITSGSTTVGSKASLFFIPSTTPSLTTGSAIKSERLSPDGSDLQFYTVSTLGNTPDRAMTIDSSQRVGIGTTSPANQLHLANATNAVMKIEGTGGYAQIILDGNGAGNNFIVSDDPLAIYTGGAERARIDSSGRLLVGTSSSTDDVRAVFQSNPTDSTLGGAIALSYTSASPADGDWLSRIDCTDSSANVAARIIAARDGGTWTSGSSHPGRLVFSTTADAASSPTERMRIQSNGFVNFTNSGSYNDFGSLTDSHYFQSTLSNKSVVINTAYNNSYTSTIQQITCLRSATSAYSFLKNVSGNGSTSFADNEFDLRGDGNGYADGSWNGGGADYAEYFEWSDGNPDEEDRRGISVVLDGEKIRPAVDGEDPIGVISGNPSVVGDAAWNKWVGKYLRDDYGSYILDENGDRQLNPDYDPNQEYVNREQRPEWDCVGLMGKLRICKGQPIGSRWIKMRDISDSVEEWLVR